MLTRKTKGKLDKTALLGCLRPSFLVRKVIVGTRCLQIYEYSITLSLDLWLKGQNGDDRIAKYTVAFITLSGY